MNRKYRSKNEKYDNSQMDIINYINRYHIKYTFLAKKLGLTNAAFSQKIKGKTFNYHQLSKLFNLIMQMATDTRKIEIPAIDGGDLYDDHIIVGHVPDDL